MIETGRRRPYRKIASKTKRWYRTRVATGPCCSPCAGTLRVELWMQMRAWKRFWTRSRARRHLRVAPTTPTRTCSILSKGKCRCRFASRLFSCRRRRALTASWYSTSRNHFSFNWIRAWSEKCSKLRSKQCLWNRKHSNSHRNHAKKNLRRYRRSSVFSLIISLCRWSCSLWQFMH